MTWVLTVHPAQGEPSIFYLYPLYPMSSESGHDHLALLHHPAWGAADWAAEGPGVPGGLPLPHAVWRVSQGLPPPQQLHGLHPKGKGSYHQGYYSFTISVCFDLYIFFFQNRISIAILILLLLQYTFSYFCSSSFMEYVFYVPQNFL